MSIIGQSQPESVVDVVSSLENMLGFTGDEKKDETEVSLDDDLNAFISTAKETFKAITAQTAQKSIAKHSQSTTTTSEKSDSVTNDRRLQALQSGIDLQKKALDETQTRLARIEAANKAAQQQLAQKNDELQQEKDKSRAEWEKGVIEMAAQQGSLRLAVKQQLQEKEKILARLTEQQARTEKQHKAALLAIKQQQEEVVRLSTQNQQLSESSAETRKEQRRTENQLHTQIGALEEAVEELADKMATIEEQRDAALQQLNMTQQKAAQVESLQKQLDNAQKTCASLREQLREKERDAAAASETTRLTAPKTPDQLMDEKARCKTKLCEYEKRIVNARQKCEQARSVVMQHKKQHGKNNVKYGELKAQFAHAQRQLQDEMMAAKLTSKQLRQCSDDISEISESADKVLVSNNNNNYNDDTFQNRRRRIDAAF